MVELSANECCGCMACLKACPVDAIDIILDDKANDIVKVNLSKCINCNKCERVCPIISPVKFHAPIRVYAAATIYKNILKSSASGGAAYIIAKKFIENGGVVFGAKSFGLTKVEHISVNDIESLSDLSGSKYVKSDISDALLKIKDCLKIGKKVLFIGTPCQVAAVINYTRDNHNLFCIDLICHGEPSISFLQRYAHETLKTRFSDSLTVQFRWKKPEIEFGTRFINQDNGKIILDHPYPTSSYMAAFFDGLSYRENCHNCIFAQCNRVSDITLGDFWGLNSKALCDRKGASLVICNTSKGVYLFNLVKDEMNFEKHTLEEAVAHNSNLSRPKKRPANKEQFYSDLKNHTIAYSVRKHLASYRKENNFFFRLYLKLAQLALKVKSRFY